MQDLLRETEDHDLAPAVSHFLNCLFGSCQAPSGKATTNSTQSKTPKKVCLFMVHCQCFELLFSF